ncbi:hypothetical protein EV2_039357 [Malus domestica]
MLILRPFVALSCPSLSTIDDEDLKKPTPPPRLMVLTRSQLITLPLLYDDHIGKNELAFDLPTFIRTGHYNLTFSSYGLLCFKKLRSLGGQVVLVNPLRGEV